MRHTIIMGKNIAHKNLAIFNCFVKHTTTSKLAGEIVSLSEYKSPLNAQLDFQNCKEHTRLLLINTLNDFCDFEEILQCADGFYLNLQGKPIFHTRPAFCIVCKEDLQLLDLLVKYPRIQRQFKVLVFD